MAAFHDPRTGRFVGRAQFARIEQGIKRTLAAQLKKAARAFEKMESAPTFAKGKQAEKSLQVARQRAAKAERQVRSAGRQRAKAESYPGWELGVAYTAHRATSNVNFNVRIRRADYQPMPRYEIEAVIHDLRLEGKLPEGYYVNYIDWQRPGHSPKVGGRSDLASFHAILNATEMRALTQSLIGLPLTALRLGALREDEV
jgi:hypothetical protein